MRFIDEVEIEVRAGDGGRGAVAFRREKYVPFGGPSGGDGGKGGDVVFVADGRLSTLLDFRYRRRLVAPNGEHGRGKDQYGRSGEDLIVPVPVGTQVFDAESGRLLCDLDEEGKRWIAAKGGRGGRGNIHFATPENRAPRYAEPGEPGECRRLRLELKLLADVGLVGHPNVGKSTLIARISRARPKIADYPFTTLVPHLGVVELGEYRSCVVADIPGLIEGASDGAGLGIRFLKHIERCRMLLYIITLDPDPKRSPLRDYDVLRQELFRFDPSLLERPSLVGVSKIDLPEVRKRLPAISRGMKRRGIEQIYPFSAVTGEGIEELLRAIDETLLAHPSRPSPRSEPLETKPSPQHPPEEEGELDIEYVR